MVEPTNFPCFKNTNLARLYGKRNARAGVMLADTSQLIVLALKTQNLARLYGKRNVRAGVMLAETSHLICQS